MHELALRTTERRSERSWRPVGSTIICISDSLRRRKWLEICCDLASPKKRYDPAFQNIPGWTRICEAWTQGLWDAWFYYDRPTAAHPVGRLLMDNDYPQQIWGELIAPIGVLSDIPYAPESDVKAYDAWLWSNDERKRYFIVAGEGVEDETVEAWQGANMLDYDSGLVVSDLQSTEGLDIVSIWKKQINYMNEIGLSGGTLDDIADPDKALHPQFDKPVTIDKVKTPSLLEFKSSEPVR